MAMQMTGLVYTPTRTLAELHLSWMNAEGTLALSPTTAPRSQFPLLFEVVVVRMVAGNAVVAVNILRITRL